MTVEYNFFDPVLNEQGQPDRVYNAEEFTNYFKTLVTTGIMRQHENELRVVADGTTMQTAVSTGTCFIEGRRMRVKAPYLLLHDTESVGLKRIDRIVVRLDLRVEARHVMPFIKKGVASANPVAPTLQRDNEVYEISLASVTVTGGRSYITNTDILDERTNEALCGWATSDIFPNYNDDTLQAVLTQVQQSNAALNNHMDSVVLHTPYGIATGTNAKTVTVNLPTSNLVDGMAVVFKNQTENTDAVTLNVNGKGAKPLLNAGGQVVLKGDLVANGIYTARYNATTENFILQGEGGDFRFLPGNELVFRSSRAGININEGANTSNSTLTKLIEIQFNVSGRYKIRYTMQSAFNAQTVRSRVYLNGQSIGDLHEVIDNYDPHVFEDEISVHAGDFVQIYASTNGPHPVYIYNVEVLINRKLFDEQVI